jgi:hypothetical protein
MHIYLKEKKKKGDKWSILEINAQLKAQVVSL